jgi:hypothetical protein
MDVKQFIIDYYHALLTPEGVKDFLHPQVLIEWHSPRGYLELDIKDIIKFSEVISKQYTTLRLNVTHIVAEGDNRVSVRYINMVTTPDDPENEKELSQSISIWELKNNKLYRGYVMSHQSE